jgi:hypothetical protein
MIVCKRFQDLVGLRRTIPLQNRIFDATNELDVIIDVFSETNNTAGVTLKLRLLVTLFLAKVPPSVQKLVRLFIFLHDEALHSKETAT